MNPLHLLAGFSPLPGGLVDSTITQVNPGATAAMWHDGSKIADKKFVLRNCRFDGPPNWHLARRHHDGHFHFIDCSFAATMRDQPPYRVIYPLNGGTPTDADKKRNADYDRTNVCGDRNYFHNSHRAGGTTGSEFQGACSLLLSIPDVN